MIISRQAQRLLGTMIDAQTYQSPEQSAQSNYEKKMIKVRREGAHEVEVVLLLLWLTY